MWYVKNGQVPGNAAETAKKFGIDPKIIKILADRGIVSDRDIREYLYGQMEDIPSGATMLDMAHGVSIIKEAVLNKKHIRVMGDYDVDGVTSTFILFEVLTRLGAEVSWFIPHRIRDGYGLHMPAIEQARANGVDVVLTCDNGIAASEEIKAAKKYGMTVVVTDHHDIPFTKTADGEKEYILPPADAVIDPKRSGDPYPFKEICGAEVAYKFTKLLCEAMEKPSAHDGLLEFAALGTVCDVMPLLGENRILVREGLKAIAGTKNVGLRALTGKFGLTGKPVSSYDVGFKIGPALNAAGRLESAEISMNLFLETEEQKADAQAEYLFHLNEERKALSQEGTERAFSIVEREMEKDSVLVVYLPETHESIAGIIAGKIREKYNKPAFVLTDSGKADVLKGSGRSIPAYSMADELNRVKDLMLGFGGHPGAAGLSLKKENLDAFRQRLNELSTLTAADFEEKQYIDMVLPIPMVTMDFAEGLDTLEPFGTGNPRPVFAQKHASAYKKQIIGKNANVLKVSLNFRNCRDGVCFSNADELNEKLTDRMNDFSVVYYPSVNEWRDRKTLQMVILDVL